MKLKVIFLLLFATFYCNAQYKTISTEEAEEILKTHEPRTTLTLYPPDVWYDRVSGYKAGDIYFEYGFIYKVLEHSEAMAGNFGIIRLDSRNLSEKEVTIIRSDIIARYKMGTPFSELAEKYKQGMNIASDSTDVLGDTFGPTFMQEANKHFVGDIYTVDHQDNRYVVVKNTEPEPAKYMLLQRAPLPYEEE